MSLFASPWGLLALLAIPIVLYFHRAVAARPRTVPLVSLWRPGTAPASAAPRHRWRDPLLAVRLAIVILLALALARPGGPGAGARRHVIVLDAGASMQARAGERTRLDQARDAAARLIDGLAADDTVSLVRAGATAELMHATGAPRAIVRQALASIAPADSGKRLAPALALAQQTLGADGGTVHVFSDLAEPATLRISAERARLTHVVLHPVGVPVDNVAIVAADARPAGRSPLDYRVVARVASFAGTPRAMDVVVRPAGGAPERRHIVLAPGARATVSVEVPAAPSVQIELDSGGDALGLDDRVALALPRTPLRVLYAGADDRFVEAALRAHPRVAVQRVPPEALPTAAADADLAVINGRAPDGLAVPALLFGTPGRTAASARLPLLDVGAEHALVRDLDLQGATVPAGAVLAADGTVALRSAAGPVMRVRDAPGARRVEVAFAAGDSSLVRLPAFPVLVARALDWLAEDGPGRALNVRAGEPLEVPTAGPVARAVIREPGAPPREAIPRDGRVALAPTERAGLLSVDTGRALVLAGINLLDERESDLRRPAVAVELGSGTPGRVGADGRFTGPLLAGLLLLLPLETWLARPRRTA